MENFDIEKLSREMPYKIPNNTFETMQNNVLAKTLNKKQAPIYKLKWIYAAAAVILLIFGANFIINYDGKTNEELPNNQAVAKVETDNLQNNSTKIQATIPNEIEQNNAQTPNENKASTSNLTLTEIPNQKINKTAQINTNLATSKKLNINPPADLQIDAVLDGFSSSEIASLSNNTEQDVYLDLYN